MTSSNARNLRSDAPATPPPLRPPATRRQPGRRQRQAPPRLTVVPPSRPHRLPVILGMVAVAILTVMFGFAAFHAQMAEAQYRLESVEVDLALEQERIHDLEIQLGELNSPAQIERKARGILGMVDPITPIDVIVDESVLVEVSDLSRPDGEIGQTDAVLIAAGSR